MKCPYCNCKLVKHSLGLICDGQQIILDNGHVILQHQSLLYKDNSFVNTLSIPHKNIYYFVQISSQYNNIYIGKYDSNVIAFPTGTITFQDTFHAMQLQFNKYLKLLAFS